MRESKNACEEIDGGGGGEKKLELAVNIFTGIP